MSARPPADPSETKRVIYLRRELGRIGAERSLPVDIAHVVIEHQERLASRLRTPVEAAVDAQRVRHIVPLRRFTQDSRDENTMSVLIRVSLVTNEPVGKSTSSTLYSTFRRKCSDGRQLTYGRTLKLSPSKKSPVSYEIPPENFR